MLIFISVEVHTDPRSVEVREGPSYDIEVDLKTSTGAVGLFFNRGSNVIPDKVRHEEHVHSVP